MGTLERAKEQQRDVKGVTFFYFTDSATVYFAVSKGSSTSPGLQDMVLRIKLLEHDLGCHLEVIHVPGTTIITERTDGLSRGVWISALHPRPEQHSILCEIFSPVPYNPDLHQWAMNKAGIPPDVICHHRRWDLPWEARDNFDRLTIWYPPPEIAAQLLYFLLQCHVERRLTTSALIVLPRVMQKRWSRPSRHVIEIGTYQREMVPFAQRSLLTIPIVLLLIPYHVRTYPDIRLDSAPATALRIQHRQQAALVRGVLDAIEQP
jgi:hypothetical protein